jgi:hypothetical protein
MPLVAAFNAGPRYGLSPRLQYAASRYASGNRARSLITRHCITGDATAPLRVILPGFMLERREDDALSERPEGVTAASSVRVVPGVTYGRLPPWPLPDQDGVAGPVTARVPA